MQTKLPGITSAACFDFSGKALLDSTTSGFVELPVRSFRQGSEEVLEIEPARCRTLQTGLGRFALATNSTAAVVQAGMAADHISVFALGDPDPSWRSSVDGRVDALTITPDGRWLFACVSREGGGQPEILVWDLSGGQAQPPCQRFPGSRHFSLSPSGKWLVTALPGEFQLRKVGSQSVSKLPIEKSRTFEKFAPIAFGRLPASGECLWRWRPRPLPSGSFGSPKILPRSRNWPTWRVGPTPLVSLTFDPACAGWPRAAGQIVQVWDLAQIRDGLQQRGLASDFPDFRKPPSAKLHFAVKPSAQSEDDKAAARMQAAWTTQVDRLTERIEAARTNGGPGLFSDLVERGRLYWSLRRQEKALRDVMEALELRPNDETARGLKAAVARDLESKRQVPGSEGSQNPGSLCAMSSFSHCDMPGRAGQLARPPEFIGPGEQD
jgi:hypothetical protein